MILIFGGEGFIGKNTIKFIEELELDYESVSREKCDLSKENEVKKYLLNFKSLDLDIIFAASVVRKKDNSEASQRENISIVKSFIKSIDGLRINSLIFLSSIDVYLLEGKKISETSPLCKTSPYGISKIYSENLLKDKFKKNLTILRLPGIYGAGDANGSTIQSFVSDIQNNIPIKLNNNGDDLRDYLHVDDVAKAILMFLKRPSPGTFNLATGKSFTIKNIVNIISKKLRVEPIFENAEDNQPSTIKISNKKFKKIFPEFKFKSIEEGISYYIDQR